MVKFENVTKKYFSFTALNNVSFSLEKGDVFGYLGPNGAGKTTSIKIMVGLLRKFTGNYTFNNTKMPVSNPSINSQFGYLPQDVGFQDWRTVDHALQTFGLLSGVDKTQLNSKIEEVLKLVGLSEVRHKKIKKLSGGMKQKVGLAQAVLHKPNLLVLDEPLTGLDPQARFQVKEIFKMLNEQGTTIFFSSHILSDIQDISTKIGIINKGTILKCGTIKELKEHLYPTKRVEIEFSLVADDPICLKNIPGILEIESKSLEKVVFHIQDNSAEDEISHNAMQYLINKGFKIRSFKPIIPSLDEIYLEYIKGAK